MSQNLAWTSELADAYVNQQQALSQAIQIMREKAKDAGNLKTTPQQKVDTKGKQSSYRSSGVMTFTVTGNTVVYEKDLGANTSAIAMGLAAFHKDTSWHAVND